MGDPVRSIMLVISVFVCVCVLGNQRWGLRGGDQNVLGSVGSVVHEQKLNIVDVVDEEGLVAGGHHVAGLLVGTIANLQIRCVSTVFHLEARASHRDDFSSIDAIQGGCTYGGHGNGASEASSNSGVDTLGPSPARADTLEAITLVTFEALRAYSHELILPPSQECSHHPPLIDYFHKSPKTSSNVGGGDVCAWAIVRTLLDDGDVLLGGNHLCKCQ